MMHITTVSIPITAFKNCKKNSIITWKLDGITYHDDPWKVEGMNHTYGSRDSEKRTNCLRFTDLKSVHPTKLTCECGYYIVTSLYLANHIHVV